jgi:glycerol-3-phosphate acyltransferase PlsX
MHRNPYPHPQTPPNHPDDRVPAGKHVRVAIDIMGGDHAPDAIFKGCMMALEELPPGDQLVLVGPQALIREMLDERGIKEGDPRIEIVAASEVIEMGDSAVEAVKAKPDSSIVKMSELGAARNPRHCDVVLSAGNTGACVAAAHMCMRRMRHVIRPGIAVAVPAFHGPVMLTDAGANPMPKPEHLWQYGVMAEVLCRIVHKIENPRVALMNIGSEESKGTGLIKQTRDLLKATPGINYIGYIEGRDFFDGAADVVVTDGLVGNTLLKAAEGMAKSLFKAIAAEILHQDPTLVMKFEPVVKAIYAKNDYHEYGGAPLLGVNGACFIAHGSSEARTIKAAIRNCRTFVRLAVNDAILQRLVEVEKVMPRSAVITKEPSDEGVRV